MYDWTNWVDESDEFENRYEETANPDGTINHRKITGEVFVEGTPQSAANFNKIEEGIVDVHTAAAQLLLAHRNHQFRIEALEKATDQETGVVVLENTQPYPFNDSIVTVPLEIERDNLNYVVVVIKTVASGGLPGDIQISERQVNGFKMAFTGSASGVVVTYAVIGGFDR